jgi:hypothetical protein
MQRRSSPAHYICGRVILAVGWMAPVSGRATSAMQSHACHNTLRWHECRHAAVNMELPWKNQSSRHVHAIEGMLQTKPARTNACNFNIILGSHRV